MANALIIYDSPADAALMTQSSAAADDAGTRLDAAQLQIAGLGGVWRSAGRVSEWVQAQFEAEVSADNVALLGFKMSQAAEYDLELFADINRTQLVYAESGFVWPQVLGIGQATLAGRTVAGMPILTDLDDYPPYRRIQLPQAFSFRVLRLTLRDPASAQGYIQLARLFIGVGVPPTYNFEIPSTLSYDDDDEVTDLGRGAIWISRGVSWRRQSVVFNDLTKAEADGFIPDFMRRVRLSKDFLFVPYPDGGLEEWRTTLYGVLTSRPRRVRRDVKNWAIQLDMREIVA